MTSLSRELGRRVPVAEVMERFTTHFAATLDVDLTPGELTPEEEALADELLRVKYGTEAWNLGTSRAFGYTASTRTALGVVTLALDVEDGAIREARLSGDLLVSDAGALLRRAEEQLRGLSLDDAGAGLGGEVPRELRQGLARLLRGAAEQVPGA